MSNVTKPWKYKAKVTSDKAKVDVAQFWANKIECTARVIEKNETIVET